MTADIKRTESLRNVALIMYANDLALLSSNPDELQATFDNVTALATESAWPLVEAEQKP